MQFAPLLHSLATSLLRNDLSGKDSNHEREERRFWVQFFGCLTLFCSLFCFIFRDKIHDLIKLGKLLDTHTFIPL